MSMVADHIALIHSPLVGPLTWVLVADELEARGFKAIVPELIDDVAPDRPFWQQHAASAARTISDKAAGGTVLVAHSGAGPLLPAIRQGLGGPVSAYIFVDAGIPSDGLSRLDLMRAEDVVWAEEFYQTLLQGESFPNWSASQLRPILPDDVLRQQMVSTLRPRGLSFFTEPIPVFAGWPDAPCAYVKFSQPYAFHAWRAQEEGWQVQEMTAGHFHMLVNPVEVTTVIINCIKQL